MGEEMKEKKEKIVEKGRTIDISKRGKPEVLCAFFDKAQKSAKGEHPGNMSLDEARKLIEELTNSSKRLYFGIVHGRYLHIDISGDEMEIDDFEKHNGEEATYKVFQNI